MGGATLEHLATAIRDDIMMWAFSHEDYKAFFKRNDTPVGQDLILLPEADGDTRCDVQTLRARAAQVQEERIAQFLQLQTEGTVEQRVMIGPIRQARALLYCDDNASVAEWRKRNEQIWEYWGTGFPAY
eukprot:5327188-Pyramimonas_sp.AAC.1